MSVFHEEVPLKDFDYDPETRLYTYPCPCGDLFEISLDELYDGEDVARCPSCSLLVKVLYDPEELPELDDDDEVEASS